MSEKEPPAQQDYLPSDLASKDSEQRQSNASPAEETFALSDQLPRTDVETRIEDLDAELQLNDLEIEDLEEDLMDLMPDEEVSERVPWFLRNEGDISEEEYSAVEEYLESQDRRKYQPMRGERREEVDGETEGYEQLNEQQVEEQDVDEHDMDESEREEREIEHEMQEHRIADAEFHEQPENPEEEAVIPWYLREQESEYLIPQIEIQQTRVEKYPDMPYNGPPLLQPLVSRLFYDHHLEDIVLLDLRGRDPPPVWGVNTIMIIATARSERQLTSVAEMTGTWLKKTAGVFPKIDGLPKKESLVIKRRRLRRKSLRKPGYLLATPKPTTWVSMYTGYQGIVLQLFTREGREEYNLEELWGDARVVDAGIIEMEPRKVKPRREKDEKMADEMTPPPRKQKRKPEWLKKAEKKIRDKKEKKKLSSGKRRRWTKEEKELARRERESLSSSNPPSSAFFKVSGNFQQQRKMHTGLSFSLTADVVRPKRKSNKIYMPTFRHAPPNTPEVSSQKLAAWSSSPTNMFPKLSDTVALPSLYEQMLDRLRDQPPFSPRDPTPNRIAQALAVQGDMSIAEKLANLHAANDPHSLRLFAHFGNLSRFTQTLSTTSDVEACKEGFTVEGHSEKGFKWAFDFFLRDMPARPNSPHWRLAMIYYLNLQMLDHANFPLQRIFDLFLMPVSQGIHIPPATFHVILNHIAISSPEHRDPVAEAADREHFLQRVHHRLETIESVLHFMREQSGYVYTRDEEVHLAIYKASHQPFHTLTNHLRDISLPLERHHTHNRGVLKKYFYKFPISPELFLLNLSYLSHVKKWAAFLDEWNSLLLNGITKDKQLWVWFWALLARGQDAQSARTALRYHFDDMMHTVGKTGVSKDVAVGLGQCVEVADPLGGDYLTQRTFVRNVLRLPQRK
jgi:ribosomal silencing factor RsfS